MQEGLRSSIESLGGLSPISTKKFVLAGDNDIAETEAVCGAKLPQDYAEFLRQYGESSFNEMVGFDPVSEKAVYVHSKETELPNPTFKGSQVAVFFGKNKDVRPSLIGKIKMYANRMPDKVIPIADDGLGNKITISLAEKDYGKVYWWDHENEWDEEDYLDEVGEPMPEEAKYQNMYLIADSFTEFLEKLKVVPE